MQFIFTEKVAFEQQTVSKANVVEGGLVLQLDEPIPDSSSDLEIELVIDVSQVQGILLVSDQDVTIETNDGSSPDDTISLKAGIPYVWYDGKYDALVFGSDVTSIFVTNASGSDARLQMLCVVDPTP